MNGDDLNEIASIISLVDAIARLGGPVRIRGHLVTTYEIMIDTLVQYYKMEQGPAWQNNFRRQSILTTASNKHAIVFFLLWSMFEKTNTREIISPMELAKTIEIESENLFDEPRKQQVVQEVLKLKNGDHLATVLFFRKLQKESVLKKTKEAMRKQIIEASENLSTLDIVAVIRGKRGNQERQIIGVQLTEFGVDFGILMMRETISNIIDFVNPREESNYVAN